MYRNIKTIQKVKFPLYSLPSNNFDSVDGISFIEGQPVDDLNMSGDSIGIRRKQSGRSDFYKLKGPIFDLGALIKSRGNHFISSDGKMFTYEKTGFQIIKCHQIDRFELRNTYSFLYIKGITIPFPIPRPPSDIHSILWARILYYEGFPWMLFDYTRAYTKNSRIKV